MGYQPIDRVLAQALFIPDDMAPIQRFVPAGDEGLTIDWVLGNPVDNSPPDIYAPISGNTIAELQFGQGGINIGVVRVYVRVQAAVVSPTPHVYRLIQETSPDFSVFGPSPGALFIEDPAAATAPFIDLEMESDIIIYPGDMAALEFTSLQARWRITHDGNSQATIVPRNCKFRYDRIERLRPSEVSM